MGAKSKYSKARDKKQCDNEYKKRKAPHILTVRSFSLSASVSLGEVDVVIYMVHAEAVVASAF